MPDPVMLPVFNLDLRDLLWRILVTVLLLLILAGPGAKMLRRKGEAFPVSTLSSQRFYPIKAAHPAQVRPGMPRPYGFVTSSLLM